MSSDVFSQTLEHLKTESEPVRLAYLYNLSALSAEKMAQFEETWAALTPARRKKVLEHLTGITEDSFEVNFDPIFIMAMGDADADVQMQAIKGLWESESPELISPFLYLLKKGKTPQLRATAASALGRFVYLGELDELDAEVQEMVEQALLETIRSAQENIEVVRRAIEAISFSAREGINRIIESAYYHDNELMRVSAVFAMGRNGNAREWGEIVIKELDNLSPAIRFEAARACGELALKRATDRLIRLIQEEADTEVQLNAIWSLGQIGGRKAESALASLIDSSSGIVQSVAQDALDELTMFADAAMMFDFAGDLDDPDASMWDEDDFDDEDDLLTYNLN